MAEFSRCSILIDESEIYKILTTKGRSHSLSQVEPTIRYDTTEKLPKTNTTADGILIYVATVPKCIYFDFCKNVELKTL